MTGRAGTAARACPPGRWNRTAYMLAAQRTPRSAACEVGRQRRLDARPRSPVTGCGKASRAACRNWRRRPGLRDAVRRGRRRPGRPIAARCTRIWCVRPVSSRTRSSACARQQLDDLEVRDRVARRVGVERAPGRIAAVAADRRLDPPARERGRPRTSARYSRSSARPPHERLQAVVRLLACARRRAGRDVSRSSRWTMPGPLGVAAGEAAAEQALDERAGRVSGARVDDEPGRLVDDEQVLVLVGDPQVERLVARARRGRALLAIDLELLPAARAGGSSAARRRRP